MTRFVVYDVFTDTPFGGNQLAVIPDARDVPEARLQTIAREFNFSESTFVYPPESPDQPVRVRIFTPTMEIPFAGHPTIGTATALRDDGGPDQMVLDLGVGPIRCWFEGENAAFTTPVALEEIAQPEPALVARSLGLPPDRIKRETHSPIMASLGLPFVISELTDREALSDCQPDVAALREGAKRYPAGLDFAQFAYVRTDSTVDARMFAPLDNIPEDPATGSACATLAALLRSCLGRDQDLSIRQGEAMGRLSLIRAVADDKGVTIHGRAVKVMEGSLLL